MTVVPPPTDGKVTRRQSRSRRERVATRDKVAGTPPRAHITAGRSLVTTVGPLKIVHQGEFPCLTATHIARLLGVSVALLARAIAYAAVLPRAEAGRSELWAHVDLPKIAAAVKAIEGGHP